MDDTQPIALKTFKVGDYLVPEDNEKCISSAIKIIGVDDKGYKCKRINFYYDGEEFFMAKDMMNRSKWITVKEGIQLSLL